VSCYKLLLVHGRTEGIVDWFTQGIEWAENENLPYQASLSGRPVREDGKTMLYKLGLKSKDGG
jgi:hypothetical protein